MQAEWERMTHGSKAAAYAGKVRGNDPPTAAKQQHIPAKWEEMALPQQQSSSSSICRQSGREPPPTAAIAAYAGIVGGSDPPTAAKAQPYHHLPNITNQYRLVSHYNCEQELIAFIFC